MPDQIPTIVPNSEIPITPGMAGSAELLPAKENIPAPAASQTNQQPSTPAAPLTATPDNKKTIVVDTRNKKKTLKKVAPDADSLTTLADLQEEEFINDVIKEHKKNDPKQ